MKIRRYRLLFLILAAVCAWYVGVNGDVYPYFKSSAYWARAVRGGTP